MRSFFFAELSGNVFDRLGVSGTRYLAACLRAGGPLLLGASMALAAAPAKLAIVDVTLHESEGGPAFPSDYTYIAGETVFFGFDVQGFTQSPESKVDLSYRIEAVDPQGVPLVEPVAGAVQTQLSPEDKHWRPTIRQSVLIPPLALPGSYKILLSVEDKIGGQQAKAEIPVPVRGRQVEPSATLVVRNLRFLRAEDGREALDPAAFQRSDTLWARFEIAGFQYGAKNRVSVEYDVSVTNPEGKALYSQPRAAVEESESFYPKRYLPGLLSLDLSKVRPGAYVLVLDLRDGIGKQSVESKYGFTVE
jgi:hypothetical protein